MKVTEILKDKKVTRRSVLQGMSAAVAAATLAGCGGSGTKTYYDSTVSPQEGLVFDTEIKTAAHTGPYNCGSRCQHKIGYKNGRILKFTSAGDIPREGSREKDNSQGTLENPIQRRACVRGYSYLQLYYQPDRLKYPMIQRGQKGDINGFERVSWDEAIEAVADAMAKAIQRRATLGYTPIMFKWIACLDTFDKIALNPAVAPCIAHMGNESTGAEDAAKFDMVGPDAYCNNISDRLNTKFMITWGLDPTRTSYDVYHAHWFNTCVKENGETPMVVISPNHSDAAAILSTGTSHSVRGKTVKIPSWITIRPATDGALAAAMCYVIYKNNLHDVDFINTKCFGFWKGDTCVSSASINMYLGAGKNTYAPCDFTDSAGTAFSKGSSFNGASFTVPAGASFEEYLISLENEWGGAAGNAVGGTVAAVDDAIYKQVLKYAASVTGVNAEVIEALAMKYATTDPALLDVGGGPQRAQNGVEWVQMMIALAAMTGNTTKMGGGPGYSKGAFADFQGTYSYGPYIFGPSAMIPNVNSVNAIYVSMNSWPQVVLTGKDYRKKDRFIADIKGSGAGIDLSKYADGSAKGASDKLLEIDVWFAKELNKLTTTEDIAKAVRAVKQIPTVITCDITMTPSATYSDIILPVSSHFEKEGGMTIGSSANCLYKTSKIVDAQYDTKTDAEIQNLILDKLGEKLGIDFGDISEGLSGEGAKTFYEMLANGISDIYKGYVDSSAQPGPSYEEFAKQGVFEKSIPKGTYLPGFGAIPRTVFGDLETSTGRINFYSPLWGIVRPATANADVHGGKDGFRCPTAQYLPNMEGYEKFFDNGNPLTGNFTGYRSSVSGRTYSLQYITNKARNRAHTVFDNVAVIKDQFTQYVLMNPADAAERGISDGKTVYVYNDRGCTKLPAKVTNTIAPGVVSIEHGAWFRAHPSETVTVWQQTKFNSSTGEYDFEAVTMPVDVGGAENMLTYDYGGTEHYIGQAVSAQGGACEVSLSKPE
ncbi:molybdopterin-containing oxidoreductase family protein [Seleniivibrio woodruffii]|uniref:molybdopterin-containing oxidoreductase family protein n=1 Tax=Seleniivibrio woodruffii TaxID=1078050 RepID=UPI00240A3F6A|nr:molybdopterin-dependent oxidoreductase [Seleniivibrio woodruffii]